MGIEDDIRRMMRSREPKGASFTDHLEPGAFHRAFGEWRRVPPGKCVLCLAGEARPGSGVCAACAD